MLIRIVKMTFETTKVDTFLSNFKQSKSKIRAFEGCEYLELLRDTKAENTFYTLSHWKGEENLENYRKSTVFKEVWAKTKILFAEKPLAFSLKSKEVVSLF